METDAPLHHQQNCTYKASMTGGKQMVRKKANIFWVQCIEYIWKVSRIMSPNFNLRISETQGGSTFFNNVLIIYYSQKNHNTVAVGKLQST